MNIGCGFHMAEGEGKSSYSKNSRIQEKVMLEAKPVLEEAIRKVYQTLPLKKTMVIVDLGCSSGPNTLHFVSEVINAIADHCNKIGQVDSMELQFVLNDLPSNDFNHLFKLLEKCKKATTDQEGETLPTYYVSGLPSSFYTRLFPQQVVHLFHSSCSLHWLTQVPRGLKDRTGVYLNKDNICITNNTLFPVVKLFQEQFHKDFSLFLKLRHEELVVGGCMVLTFCARKNDDVFDGSLSHLFELVAQSLQSLVVKGLVEKKKLDSFNLPLYEPTVAEVENIVQMHAKLFQMDQIQLLKTNWDPFDDSHGDVVHNSAQSGENVSNWTRAVLESPITVHFGESILDALFVEYARRVAKHLETKMDKISLVVMSLKKK